MSYADAVTRERVRQAFEQGCYSQREGKADVLAAMYPDEPLRTAYNQGVEYEKRGPKLYELMEEKDAADPGTWLKVGQRVRAISVVYEDPGDMTQLPEHALPGEYGTVVHTEHDFWPTVRFDMTGTSTCVTPLEVEGVSGVEQELFERGVRDGEKSESDGEASKVSDQYKAGLAWADELATDKHWKAIVKGQSWASWCAGYND